MSGIYDMKAVRLSKRSSYVKFTNETEQAMSSLRHIDRLRAPIIIAYGTHETPEFQRQNRDFAAAVKAAGKPVELIEAPHFNTETEVLPEVSDEMRRLVEDEWPELVHKLPPNVSQSG
jgi:hypothetical protein